ncbi:DUF488 family protein [Methanobacterium sp.]|uniref:DUF488 family protein, N3 subclade n=1 Tax=Methanobacterium sp. TaxID=2164 RepID=UPI0031590A98
MRTTLKNGKSLKTNTKKPPNISCLGHRKFNEFSSELKDKSKLIDEIKEIEKDKGKVTLIYSAKDKEHNNAVVLEHTLRKL